MPVCLGVVLLRCQSKDFLPAAAAESSIWTTVDWSSRILNWFDCSWCLEVKLLKWCNSSKEEGILSLTEVLKPQTQTRGTATHEIAALRFSRKYPCHPDWFDVNKGWTGGSSETVLCSLGLLLLFQGHECNCKLQLVDEYTRHPIPTSTATIKLVVKQSTKNNSSGA